jgi:hypothetical protein
MGVNQLALKKWMKRRYFKKLFRKTSSRDGLITWVFSGGSNRNEKESSGEQL